MDKLGFLERMLAKGKIDQKRYDKAIATLAEKVKVKEVYKSAKDKTKLTKPELIEIIEKLI